MLPCTNERLHHNSKTKKLRTVKQIAAYNVAECLSSEEDIEQLQIPQSLNKLVATFLYTYYGNYPLRLLKVKGLNSNCHSALKLEFLKIYSFCRFCLRLRWFSIWGERFFITPTTLPIWITALLPYTNILIYTI